jgi:rhamnose transport system permease protein
VVIARHIDLSIASTTGLSAYVTLSIVVPNGWGLWQSLAIGAGIGLLVGTVNGLLVAGLSIPSLVVTLGTLSIVRGILYFYSDAGRFTPDVIPQSLINLGLDTIFEIPIIFWIAIGFALFAAWWMRYTPVGRDLFAIGSNPPAAQLVGINIFQRTLLAFIWSGLMAGIAGVLYIGQFAFVDASAFINQELAVVTAVVVGGVNIFGGSGTIIGALLGALLIRVIAGGLVAVGIDPFWQQAVNGVLLITAIGLDRILALRSQAKIQRLREHRVEEQSWRE